VLSIINSLFKDEFRRRQTPRQSTPKLAKKVKGARFLGHLSEVLAQMERGEVPQQPKLLSEAIALVANIAAEAPNDLASLIELGIVQRLLSVHCNFPLPADAKSIAGLFVFL